MLCFLLLLFKTTNTGKSSELVGLKIEHQTTFLNIKVYRLTNHCNALMYISILFKLIFAS